MCLFYMSAMPLLGATDSTRNSGGAAPLRIVRGAVRAVPRWILHS